MVGVQLSISAATLLVQEEDSKDLQTSISFRKWRHFGQECTKWAQLCGSRWLVECLFRSMFNNSVDEGSSLLTLFGVCVCVSEL